MNTRTFFTSSFVLLLVAGTMPAMAQSTWSRVPTPNPSATRNLLRGISGTSASDMWTVGEKEIPPTGGSTNLANLVLHYDGSTWTEVMTPNPAGANYASLWDVAALSPTDAWSTGQYSGSGTSSGSQLLHWNGTAWTNAGVSFPAQSFLWDLDASAANEVWAVGGYLDPAHTFLLSECYVLHYNGQNWSQQFVPAVGTYRNRFDAVDALTPTDVWAVGTWGNRYGDYRPLLMHYDGSAWTNTPAPASLQGVIGEMLDVAAVAPNDVWAVGDRTTGGIILLHWDGTAWTEVPSLHAGGAFAVLGPNNIYAVGGHISHWDGTSWAVVDSLSQQQYPALNSTTVLPTGEVWAAGVASDASLSFATLVYRSNATPPQVRINASAPQIPAGGSAQLTAMPSRPGNYQFSWSPAAGLSNPAIANPVAAPTSTTTYTVTMTDQTTGEVAQATVLLRVGGVTGLPAEADALPVQVWPNPFTDAVTCSVAAERAGAATITITDVMGREVARQQAWFQTGDNKLTLQSSGSAGLYLLTVRTADHQRQIRLVRN